MAVKIRDVDFKAAVWHGAGLSIFFFVIYGGYGLAFSFGTTLINRNEGALSASLDYPPPRAPFP